VRVQGPEAAPEIVRALAVLNGEEGKAAPPPEIEVIIMARGGGSLEDLYPFNTEEVARAVFRSRLPVVSAIGHETDFTIADFVADLRAPTPSAAAEMVVPSREHLRRQLAETGERFRQARRRLAAGWRERVERAALRLKSPARILGDYRLLVDERRERLCASLERRLEGRRQELGHLHGRLERVHPGVMIGTHRMLLTHRRERLIAGIGVFLRNRRSALDREGIALRGLDPLGVLQRGYSITRRLADGLIVKRAVDLAAGEGIAVRLAAGEIRARVEGIRERGGVHHRNPAGYEGRE